LSNPDALLEQFLAERDVVCPSCAYNLRGLKSDRCPECGDVLELSLRLVEPRQAALITGLVGLSAGAGLGGLLVIYALILTTLMGRRGLMDEFLAVNLIGFVAHAVVILLWVRYWHRVRRASAGKRWLLAGTCWTMPLAFIIVFAAMIR
jgi:hypothetical protein